MLQGLYEEATHLPERRVVLLGAEGTGKSAILEALKLCCNENSSSSLVSWSWGSPTTGVELPRVPTERREALVPTVGLNVAKLCTGQERLLVWDLGGAKALRSIWRRYVADAEALIWVVDAAADAEMTDDSRLTLKTLLKEEPLASAPLLVFANKQDLKQARDPVKTSMALDLLSDAELRPQCVQPCSVVTGEGIREGLEWLVDRLRHPEGIIKTSIKSS